MRVVISAAVMHSPVDVSLAIVPGMAVNLAMMPAASNLGAILLKGRILRAYPNIWIEVRLVLRSDSCFVAKCYFAE